MHAFTIALPEHHAIAGLRPAARTALVVCGYHPTERWYYGMVAGIPTPATALPDLHRQGLSLNELLGWLGELQIGLPFGLGTQLRRDGYAPVGPWQQFYWGEQGPELRGLVPAGQEQAAGFLVQAQRAA